MQTNNYKGVELFSDLIKYNKQDNKIVIKFTLNETEYSNGTLIPVGASEKSHTDEFKKLLKWAKTVIDENIKS